MPIKHNFERFLSIFQVVQFSCDVKFYVRKTLDEASLSGSWKFPVTVERYNVR